MDQLDSTGTEGMRPLRIGEMLPRIWDLLRRNIAAYLKLAGPLLGAGFLAYAVMLWAMHISGMFPTPPPGTNPDPGKVWIFLAWFVGAMPMMLAVYAIYEGAACLVALAALRGERTTFAEAYRTGMRRAGSLIWLMILRMLAVMLPWMILGAVAGVLAVLSTMRGWTHPGALFVLIPLLVLGYLGAMVWVVWIALHWSLATPACVAEELTGWQALKRSGQLSRGGKWRILGVIFLVALVGMAAAMALEMVGFALFGFGAIAQMLAHPGVSYSPAGAISHFALWIVPVGIILAVAFCAVLALQYASYEVALTVLYQDQRFRQEGSLALPLGS